MSDVFISFIHEEGETAGTLQRFVNQMLSGQAQAFLSSDKFHVYAGEDWLERIFDELKSAKVVLLLLSETSVKRPWVNFEAGAGWFTGKKVIPRFVVPASLAEAERSLKIQRKPATRATIFPSDLSISAITSANSNRHLAIRNRRDCMETKDRVPV